MIANQAGQEAFLGYRPFFDRGSHYKLVKNYNTTKIGKSIYQCFPGFNRIGIVIDGSKVINKALLG